MHVKRYFLCLILKDNVIAIWYNAIIILIKKKTCGMIQIFNNSMFLNRNFYLLPIILYFQTEIWLRYSTHACKWGDLAWLTAGGKHVQTTSQPLADIPPFTLKENKNIIYVTHQLSLRNTGHVLNAARLMNYTNSDNSVTKPREVFAL